MHDRIAVVATGPSLTGVDLSELTAGDATIIAVNGASRFLPRADAWFTLDPSHANHEHMRACGNGCRVYVAPPDGYKSVGNVTRLVRIEGGMFGNLRAPGGLAETPGHINTGNSAFGALGLAYHWRPKKIAMFGVDGTQEERVCGGMPNDLSHLPELFATSVDQLNSRGIIVVNGSENSRVDCFPRMSPSDAIGWLYE